MGDGFGGLIKLKKIASKLEASLIHVRGECVEICGLEDIKASGKITNLSGYLGLCLKLNYLHGISSSRPQCIVTYESWADRLIEHCNDEQPLSLLLVNDRRSFKEVIR